MRQQPSNFLACNFFDVLPYFKDDMASMEHPVFSLATKPDMRALHYEHNGNTITIKPSYDGLATIHDKDILLYCASYLRAAINDRKAPSRTVRFTVYDFFSSTNRLTDGRSYQRFKASLERLSGTRIQTNIKTGGLTIEEGFGIIDAWRAVKEDKSGRVIAAEIELSKWFYKSIIENELLTINPDYFLLRKPIERRLYELARKHCGNHHFFKIGLDKLQKKMGTTAPVRKLRSQIREIEKINHLPDYEIALSEDIVTFTSRCWKIFLNSSKEVSPILKLGTYERARAAAPGWDINVLEQQWREWINDKEPPQKPDAAFVVFCRKKHQRANGLK